MTLRARGCFPARLHKTLTVRLHCAHSKILLADPEICQRETPLVANQFFKVKYEKMEYLNYYWHYIEKVLFKYIFIQRFI